jgi:hypothetical protein
VLKQEAANGNVNAQTLLSQLPATLGLTTEQCSNMIHQIADDPYTGFLVEAYGGFTSAKLAAQPPAGTASGQTDQDKGE